MAHFLVTAEGLGLASLAGGSAPLKEPPPDRTGPEGSASLRPIRSSLSLALFGKEGGLAGPP